MDEQTIRQRISTQRDFFATGATLPLSFRLKQLEQLKLALKRHEQDLYTALKADLGKSRMESYMCEIGTDALGADLDAEAPVGADAGKESADTVIAVRGEELPVSVTLWHRADHESMELSGPADTGTTDRCTGRR